ncbi:hypothetical protein FXO38_17947 [Capsicum annuum]|nr:hypothetical protein FXO38_17947 [Capsicum annuum]
MPTIGMSELPEFEERFWQYKFEWMMRVPKKYSDVLVYEFYATYKGDNVLSLVRAAMIAGCIVGYKFDVGDFLCQELRDREVGAQKELLAYPCIIMQICLAMGVLELPRIDEMIEAKRKFNIGIIRDADNPLA